MELPFKYIVLYIIKTLKDRNLPLTIDTNVLVDYLTLLLQKSSFTTKEKQELAANLDLEFELSSLQRKYYHYIDINDNKILFDDNYIRDLNTLIDEETQEYDKELIANITFIMTSTTEFLDIIGVKIRKELYYYLQEIEKELEECYNEMCNLENYVGIAEVNTSNLINKIKKLNMKKIITLLNTSNLIPYIERYDLQQYAKDVLDKVNELEELTLLLEDDNFGEKDISYDPFLRSIFISGDSYICNLMERLIIETFGISDSQRYSIIKFYTTFLNLLEREIKVSNEYLHEELIIVKYRLMNTIDSIYGTSLFMNIKIQEDKEFEEDYFFVEVAVYYFIKELLMYDNKKYINDDCNTENIIIYLDSTIKKLLIETYYTLTKDKDIISEIKENPLYGVNTISSSFLKDLVDKPKTKTKEK